MVEDVTPGVVQIVASSSTGSGFIIDADGRVVTNEHVVRGFQSVTVRISGGQSYTGRVLGVDEVADLALVEILASRKFDPVELGDSDEVAVGEEVAAMGFPLDHMLGGSPTITRGIISAKRVFRDGVFLLQTDAAINPGNSGGPLFDRAGKVVGVNTSKLFDAGDGRAAEGIGLAVAINELKDRLEALVNGRNVLLATPTPVQRPTLGLAELKAAFNSLPSSFEQLDLEDANLSIDDLGFEDYVDHLIVYFSSSPIQFFMAGVGELTAVERIALDTLISSPQLFLTAFQIQASIDSSYTSTPRILHIRQTGDRVVAVQVDMITDDIELRVDIIIFRRGDIIGLIYSYVHPKHTDPSVSSEELARYLDRAIIKFLE